MMHELSIASPLGPLTVKSTGDAVTALAWRESQHQDKTPVLLEATKQLQAYFDGQLYQFDLPLFVDGTDFQKSVCDMMSAIPFGETRTYGEIAKSLEIAPQAVGVACGGNPIPIIIPCHRVLGASSLGGFSAKGGIETKVWLLRHEGAAGLLI